MTRSTCLLAAAFATAFAAQAYAGIAFIVTTPPHNPPPVAVVEHPGNAPYKDAVWIDGQWSWKGGHYVWVSGHWQHAPNGFHHWRRGQWAQRGGAWIFNPGKWF